MEEFATARAAPVERDIGSGQAREFWKFLLVRPDLLSWFVEADPVWDGVNLLVNASFLNQAGGMCKLVTLLCYCASWWNWSETRWCAVKCSSRKMLRSEVVGIRHVVRMLQGKRDTANSYINGYARFTEECRFYLCVAACSSQPAEAVHMQMLKDNRLLKHWQVSRIIMEEHLEYVCNLSPLLWERLRDVVGGSRTWMHLRSECIRSAVIGAGYMEMDVFSVVKESPWKYTQGDVAHNVEVIGDMPMDELPREETAVKIATGLAHGEEPSTYVEQLEQLKNVAMSSDISERAHGFHSKIKAMHKMFGPEMLASKGNVSSCRPLFFGAHNKLVQQLEEKLARTEQKKPPRCNSQALAVKRHMEDISTFAEGIQAPDRAAHWVNGMDVHERIRHEEDVRAHIDEKVRLQRERCEALKALIGVLQREDKITEQEAGKRNVVIDCETFAEVKLDGARKRLGE